MNTTFLPAPLVKVLRFNLIVPCAIAFTLLVPLVCNAQKAHRVSGGNTGPTSVPSGAKAYRLQEVVSDNVQEYNLNKAYSLNKEAEDESYTNEVFVTVGTAIPCGPFASRAVENVVQGAKVGAAVHINYTAWFVKYMGIGFDINGEFFGYDFSKIPSYTPTSGEIITRTVKTGWNLILSGISLRTKLPLYQNSVFLTGRVFLHYGMINSPTSKVSYKTQTGVDADEKPLYQNGSTVLLAQFVSHKLILGGGVGIRVRIKKRLYILGNFDYGYTVSNNTKTKITYSYARDLTDDYSSFSIGAGVAYAF
ncbi:MAG: hypothetical protein LBG17_04500 [Bacteroidales bacterium]|jgi:hypothetical protein|nr:hypothetical protein [Bacteroidales bacterium]